MYWPGGGPLCALQEICMAAGLDFVFHMFFLVKYSKSLEEGSFRGRSADFLWMLLLGETSRACITSLIDLHSTCQQGHYCAQHFLVGLLDVAFTGLLRYSASEGCTRGWHAEGTGRTFTFILFTVQHVHRVLEGSACLIPEA